MSTTVVSCDFESGAIPAEWAHTGTTNLPAQVVPGVSYPALAPYTGTKALQFNTRNAAAGLTDILIIPVDMTGYSNATVSFAATHDIGYQYADDRVEVLAGTTNDISAATLFFTVHRWSSQGDHWELHSSGIPSGFDNRSFYLFVRVVSEYGDNIGMDTFTVIAQSGSGHSGMGGLPTFSRTAPSAMTFSLTPNTMSSESPLNRSVQTAELPGARWVASFSWQNLTDADARILKAWLNKLSGRAGRFYLYDYTHPTPSGSAQGVPLVKGAGQSGRTLQTDGWTANQANLLLPGDYIGIGSQLCIITETAASDGSSNATLTFEPPLRSAPTDNAPIITTRPTCIMMLTSDEQDKFAFMEKNVTNVQIDCLEAF